MSDTTFYYIIGGLAAILAVLLFNSYKEKRYRDEVRRQFGHSDQDALLDSKREEVRDGQGVLNQGMMHHQHSQAVAEQELSRRDHDRMAQACLDGRGYDRYQRGH